MKVCGTHPVGVLVSVCLFVFPCLAIAQGPGGGPGNNLNQQVAALEARMTAAEAAVSALTAENANQATQIVLLQQGHLVQAAQIVALQAEKVPVGTIIAYAAEAPPAGYLECDGSVLLRADYPALFAAIGTAFGAGDGSTTFHLPEFRGQFLRGWSHGTPFFFDPDRADRIALYPGGGVGDHVGSLQAYSVQNHAHIVNSGALNLFGAFVPIVGGNAIGAAQGGTTGGVFGSLHNETRPWNVSVMYAIKY